MKELQPFRTPLIILGVLLVVFLIVGVVVPAVNESLAKQTPIVSISATNENQYSRGQDIPISDFAVIATHENGRTSKLSPDDVEMRQVTISPVGATTMAAIYLIDDHSIYCNVEVSIAREKVASFPCGYPDITNVTAVLYSNGELCFEGYGDVMVCDEGQYPWLSYEQIDEYPITAVSFEQNVLPTDMNFWFADVPSLTYIAKIPASVKTMSCTFRNCTGLTVAADWSGCPNLLNINEVYSGCTSLVETCAIQPSTRTAYRAFADCISLLACADSSNAVSLTNAAEMYAGCINLVHAEVGPNVRNMNSMFWRCINLKVMPQIPETVIDMRSAFADDVSLLDISTIPAGVEYLSGAFANCQLIHGEVAIHCDATDFGGMFGEACIATNVNLVGSSHMLHPYANTSTSGNVYVNGLRPNPNITDYGDVFREDGTLLSDPIPEPEPEPESEPELEPEPEPELEIETEIDSATGPTESLEDDDAQSTETVLEAETD